MEALFTWTTAQFGLAVGLLIVAVVGLTRFVLRLLAQKDAQHEKALADLEAERDLYRDRWIKAVDRFEVADEAAQRLAAPRRRSGGS